MVIWYVGMRRDLSERAGVSRNVMGEVGSLGGEWIEVQSRPIVLGCHDMLQNLFKSGF